jgi:AraC-like DNA-binding protein
MSAIGAIRLFAGKHWQPAHIGLASEEKPGKTISAYFPKTRFHLGQTHCFITLSNQLLRNPFRPREKPGKSLPRFSKIKPSGDFIGELKQALHSYLRDGAPSLELAADIACLSTRTLQRQLADDGLTYRDLLDAVRYETAIDLMQDTDNTISDIASLLGYSDPSHFARAFRRMASVSPREYLQNG